ncbi:6-phosphogluconolactonase [Gilvimarinus sp. SDUM040013]|uniref:6-phosphogluconolactonase n=1 Tax=Gilvimarinus gilvus TaxID=3058038 RepID=A0ABU4RX06_9GAMM|nr:6-phosphogluconolactonase [Gilvimarinus sp. SDUM040013]MDO3386693.1 6-phosphogluconolactonase [Gilvimarinus sp. SDUM040013]MDX6849420.1 6-phosphogluconolactonase [Gilvimarinus sp. SDUM040013]
MAVIERFFDSREAMIDAVFEHSIGALQAAIGERAAASFMVSGGSSPAPIYKRLSEADLDWKKIQVALVDERWVDIDHDKSNEAFIVNTLMQNNATKATLVGMKNSAVTAADGIAKCESAYQKLPSPFDVTVLGMGPDGHTASLFPHAKGLTESLETNNLCSAITAIKSEVTGDCTERMTLSLKGIVNSRHVLLLISGDEKLATYREALAGDDVAAMPVRAVLQQDQVPVTVYWAP